MKIRQRAIDANGFGCGSASGSPARPSGRPAMFRSITHIYAQVIDDQASATVAAASTAEPISGGLPARCARQHGRGASHRHVIAERLKEKGITRVVFDRGAISTTGA